MKRIFLVSGHSLLASGVECLLREAGLEIAGRAVSADEAYERIEALQPDAVVLEGGPQGGPAPDVLRILRLGAPVIALSSQGNQLYIYCHERRLVESVRDLVDAIESVGNRTQTEEKSNG